MASEDNLVDTDEEAEDNLVDTDEEDVKKTEEVPEMLWCSRLRRHLGIDNFSKKMQKEPDNSKRTSLRDAVPYKLTDDPSYTRGGDVPEGEPTYQEEWHQAAKGGYYKTNNEALYDQFENTIFYDDRKSGINRLGEAINEIINREAMTEAFTRDATETPKKSKLS